ncbi:acetyl-CoA synthetase [Mycena floridula]|nr:acetyl-CoA synthetase [Mycena floridula]
MSTPTFTEYLVTDDLTILLGLIGATLFLLHSFYKPQPLVHPILLGRQSDVARVRNPGESAVYRNYGTGLMGRFPVRPHKDVHILLDFLRVESDAPRTLWNTKITNSALQDRVAAFGTGLLRLAGVQANESNVLLLLNDGIEFVISDLALATHSIPSFTLSSANLLSPVLETHPPSAIITHAELLPQLLELIYDAGEHSRNHTIIIVGEPSPQTMATVASRVKVLKWADVEREGVRVEKILSPVPKASDVFTVSFFPSESGHIQGVQLTHENVTAGVAAVRALVPMAQGISSLDTIVSAYPLGLAFGRAIAYSAIFESCNFATVNSSRLFGVPETSTGPKYDANDVLTAQSYPIPSATILFLKAEHSQHIMEDIMKEAQKSYLFAFAWRHKVSAIQEGFLTKDSLWDRLVFDGARAKVTGEAASTLRAVIVSGGPILPQFLTAERVAFSTPFVNAFSHPAVCGPILASHPLDVQDFSPILDAKIRQLAVPSGPPSINIEAKLVGVSDEAVENGADPEGVLLVRGPPVGKLLSMDDYVNVSAGNSSANEDDDWIGTGVRATVLTSGAFRIIQE